MNKGRPARTIDERLHATAVDGDRIVFEQVKQVDGVRLVVTRWKTGWLSTVDDDPLKTAKACNLSYISADALRELADALAPYRTPEQVNYTDVFCHTCGSKTKENRPMNSGPSMGVKRG